jgi:hypothetical protein
MKQRTVLFFSIGFLLSLFLGWYIFPLVLYKSEPQPLEFSHNIHVEKNGMTCDNCHSIDAAGRFQGIPVVAKCAECHSAMMGETPAEKILVEQYVIPGKEIPWKVYSRQPDNAFFSHASHVVLAQLQCAGCHGDHGTSDQLEVYHVNRISGYSRDIWGTNISGFSSQSWDGMKMDKCIRCHKEHQQKDGCIACHK